jgi:hypothetical protein
MSHRHAMTWSWARPSLRISAVWALDDLEADQTVRAHPAGVKAHVAPPLASFKPWWLGWLWLWRLALLQLAKALGDVVEVICDAGHVIPFLLFCAIYVA